MRDGQILVSLLVSLKEKYPRENRCRASGMLIAKVYTRPLMRNAKGEVTFGHGGDVFAGLRLNEFAQLVQLRLGLWISVTNSRFHLPVLK